MEQRIFIKIAFEDGRNATQTYRKLVDRHRSDVLRYSRLVYWRREFSGGRWAVEDGPRSGRPPDCGVRLCVEYVLMCVPHLREFNLGRHSRDYCQRLQHLSISRDTDNSRGSSSWTIIQHVKNFANVKCGDKSLHEGGPVATICNRS
jgi:hypothetical protein